MGLGAWVRLLVVRPQGSSKRRGGVLDGREKPLLMRGTLSENGAGPRSGRGLTGNGRQTGTGAGLTWERPKGLEQGRSLKRAERDQFRTRAGCGRVWA